MSHTSTTDLSGRLSAILQESDAMLAEMTSVRTCCDELEYFRTPEWRAALTLLQPLAARSCLSLESISNQCEAILDGMGVTP